MIDELEVIQLTDVIINAQKEIELLVEENKQLKEALEFYADYEAWKEASCSDEYFYLEDDCDDNCQGGKLARQVLKELK